MTPGLIYLTVPHTKLPIKIREITLEEFNQYRSDCELVNGFDYYSRRLREIKLNKDAYFAIKEFYTSLLQKNDVTPIGFDFKKEGFIDINRCFINFITSFTSFIEHCEKKIIVIFGEKSEQYNSFKESLRNLYDDNLTYRLLYNLRNFSVHSGFPIEYVNFDRIAFSPPENGCRYEVGIFFSKKKFLASDTLCRKMGAFMDKLDDLTKVCPFLNELMPLIESILNDFIRMAKPEYIAATNTIVKLSNDLNQPKLGLTKPTIKNGRIDYYTILIPVEIAHELHQHILELKM